MWVLRRRENNYWGAGCDGCDAKSNVDLGSLVNLVLHLYRDAVAGKEDGDGAVHRHRQREDEEPAPAT
jgi:hypothetical protein